MHKKNRLTLYIFIAMVLGAAVGYFVYTETTADFKNSFSANISLLTTIFLRLVQMIIAPLVFWALLNLEISKLLAA